MRYRLTSPSTVPRSVRGAVISVRAPEARIASARSGAASSQGAPGSRSSSLGRRSVRVWVNGVGNGMTPTSPTRGTRAGVNPSPAR